MKKITIILLIVLAVATVSLSGCLGKNTIYNPVVGVNNSTDSNNNYVPPSSGYPGSSMWMERDEAEIHSLDLFIRNGNVIARITTQLNSDESLDLRGIKVIQFGNTVKVYVPSIEPANTQGNQIVDVKIGTVRQFSKGGSYTVVVNSKNKSEDKVTFRFENETLVVFKPASVHSATVDMNGSDVVAIAEIMVLDKEKYSVDGQNITFRDMHKREFNVYIPIRISGEPQPGTFEPIYYEVVIGDLDQFSNGRYEIDLNDRKVSFTIQNGQLTTENSDEYED